MLGSGWARRVWPIGIAAILLSSCGTRAGPRDSSAPERRQEAASTDRAGTPVPAAVGVYEGLAHAVATETPSPAHSSPSVTARSLPTAVGRSVPVGSRPSDQSGQAGVP